MSTLAPTDPLEAAEFGGVPVRQWIGGLVDYAGLRLCVLDVKLGVVSRQPMFKVVDDRGCVSAVYTSRCTPVVLPGQRVRWSDGKVETLNCARFDQATKYPMMLMNDGGIVTTWRGFTVPDAPVAAPVPAPSPAPPLVPPTAPPVVDPYGIESQYPSSILTREQKAHALALREQSPRFCKHGAISIYRDGSCSGERCR